MAGGKDAERLAIVRIDRDRLFQERLGDDIVLSSHVPEMGQRPHHQTPGVQAFRGVALAVEIFRRIELRLDRGDDRLGDLVLHREHVGEAAIVTLGPDVASSCDVVELRRDAHAVAVLAHAAFDYVTDSEFLPDLLDVNGLAFESERRVPRDDEEPAQLGKSGDEVLADAVREILLLRIVAHVDEGQHRDGGTVGQRQRGPRPLIEYSRGGPVAGAAGSSSFDGVLTAPMKRWPLRGMVRISFWSWPVSPSAFRTA